MREMVLHISSQNKDIEICEKEQGRVRYKAISSKVLISELINFLERESSNGKKNIKLLNPQIIALNSHHVVINQPGDKKIVHLSTNNKTYKINMPNSIYIMGISSNEASGKILKIEAYAYKEYQGEDTELFEYPLPNELLGNAICMGNAPREIVDQDYVAALEKVIFTPYSHASFSGVNGFTNSEQWFEYLSQNKFPYKLLKPLKKKLQDVLHG